MVAYGVANAYVRMHGCVSACACACATRKTDADAIHTQACFHAKMRYTMHAYIPPMLPFTKSWASSKARSLVDDDEDDGGLTSLSPPVVPVSPSRSSPPAWRCLRPPPEGSELGEAWEEEDVCDLMMVYQCGATVSSS